MPTTKHILVYSDSLTWGIVPTNRQRLPFEERWPGVLHAALNEGRDGRIRLTEDCLNGRRTAFEDPYKPGRNALSGIQQVIEAQSPLESPRHVRRADSLEGSVSWDVPVSIRASFVSALSVWSPRCGLTIRASTPR